MTIVPNSSPSPSATVAYTSITVSNAVKPVIDTGSLFNEAHIDNSLSPIDNFIENTNKLNLIVTSTSFLEWEQSTFIILAYVSAVESYFRSLLRNLVNIDEYAQRLAGPQMIMFGAAIHKNKDILPEALLEKYSLASQKGITDAIREVAGIKGQLPKDIMDLFAEFKKVCELRHCCVHRYGRLGSKNAVELGLERHQKLIEKPLALEKKDLEKVAEIVRSFTKAMNSHIFATIMDRSVKNQDEDKKPLYNATWTWDFRKDRKRFLKYYSLFASLKDSIPSPSHKDIYANFKVASCLNVAKKAKKTSSA